MSNPGPSSDMKTQIGRSSSLLDALDAVSKWQPTALLTATALFSVLLAVLFGAVTAFFAQKSGVLAGFTGLLGFILVASVALIGLNAAGIWLSDEVWGRKQRTLIDSVLASAFSAHRLLAVIAIEFLFFLAFIIALTLVFLICKIPGVGPLLYAVAMPAGVIASGIVLFALIYIAIPLASPAIWNGMPILRTIILLQAVARQRMLKAVIMMLLLGLMTTIAIGFVWAILGLGALVVASLSAIVLGVSGGGIQGIMQLFSSGSGDGYAYAIGFGASVLFLLGANPGLLIALKGASIIYRDVSEGLSLEAAEQEMNKRMSDIKTRAEAARAQAMTQMQAPQPLAPTSPATNETPAAGMQCPSCQTAITPDDVFCGNCGHKLK